MSPATVIGLLIAAGEGHASGTAALVATLTEALGSGSSIVAEDGLSPADADILRMGEQLHAAAVVAIMAPPGRTTVHLRVHVVRDDRWIDRWITFLPADTIVERGRAIGLTVASILLAETSVIDSSPKPNSQPSPPAADLSAPVDTGGGEATVTRGANRASDRDLYSLDLSSLGTMGVGGPAAGFGGSAHFEWAMRGSFWPRVGAGVRGAPVAGLNGNDVATWLTAGAAWRPIRARGAGHLGLATCLDAGVLVHLLSHSMVDGGSAHESHVLPAAHVTLEGSWRLGGSWDVVAAAGAELAFGTTEVSVAGRRVARLPWTRALASFGLRFAW